MEIKGARIVDQEGKSQQQIEKEIVEGADNTAPETPANNADTPSPEPAEPATPEPSVDPIEPASEPAQELTDELFFSRMTEKLGREINSYEDLEVTKEIERELPEHLKAIQEYQEKTGRTLQDYVASQRDYDSIDDDTILMMYRSEKTPFLSRDEIREEILDTYGEEDIDDEKDIKRKEREKKKEIAEARKHFNEQKEQYKIPLESRVDSVPEDVKERLARFEQYEASQNERQALLEKQRQILTEKTDQFFGDKFEGFKFNVGEDNELTYKIEDVAKVKDGQMGVAGFLEKFLDKDGNISDVAGYHKAIFTAMNADRIAKHAYEQGIAAAIKNGEKAAKHIQMDPHAAAPEMQQEKPKARVVGGSKSSGFGPGRQYR